MEQLTTRYDYLQVPVRSFPTSVRRPRGPAFGLGVPGGSWGGGGSRKRSGYISFLLHVIAISAVLTLSSLPDRHVQTVRPVLEHVTLIAPSKDVYMLPPAHQEAGGGGGGGDMSKIQAPQGRLPKVSMQQITPPALVVRNEHPKLAVEPTRGRSSESSDRDVDRASSRRSGCACDAESRILQWDRQWRRNWVRVRWRRRQGRRSWCWRGSWRRNRRRSIPRWRRRSGPETHSDSGSPVHRGSASGEIRRNVCARYDRGPGWQTA